MGETRIVNGKVFKVRNLDNERPPMHDNDAMVDDGSPKLELPITLFSYDPSTVHDTVIGELERLGILRDDLLLSGYDATEVNAARRTTFAVRLGDISRYLEPHDKTGEENIPYDYAFDAAMDGDGGVGEVAVYDPEQLVEMFDEEYEVKPGRKLKDATLLRVRYTQ